MTRKFRVCENMFKFLDKVKGVMVILWIISLILLWMVSLNVEKQIQQQPKHQDGGSGVSPPLRERMDGDISESH